MKIVIFLLNPEKQGFPPGPLLRAVTFISWLLPVYMKCCKYLFMDISGVSSFHPVPLKTVKPQKSGIRFWYVYRIMVSKAPFVLRSYHILLLQINFHINIWYRAGASHPFDILISIKKFLWISCRIKNNDAQLAELMFIDAQSARSRRMHIAHSFLFYRKDPVTLKRESIFL